MSSPVPTIDRPPPEPPPHRKLGWVLLVVAALVAGVTVVVIGLDQLNDRRPRPAPLPPAFDVPELNAAPGATIPTATTVARARGGTTVSAWAERLSEKTEIPARSLVAYAQAEIAIRASDPDCKINWATLAGVGRVESHHGRYGGSDIGDDGVLSPPIIGIPLDGSPGVKAIPDTDGGHLDGDKKWDRAVGAMQFLPTTWARWGARAANDGAEANPQDMDDAALSAARYLCASGGDLSSGAGWWRAVLTYNESVTYGRNVFDGADAYAKAAAKL